MSSVVPSVFLAYGGFLALSLAMPRHYGQAFPGRKPGAKVPTALRIIGVAALGAALAVCIARWHVGMGITAWVGVLTVAAVLLVLVLTYSGSWRARPFLGVPLLLAAGAVLTQIWRF